MILPGVPNLGGGFRQYFEVVPALSEVLKDEVYRIRHQVYCEDLGFESVRANGREIDEYDDCSVHLLIRSVQSGDFIGCTRIIRPSRDNPDAPLPFETACAGTLNREMISLAGLARHSVAEVSRLAVISRYRKRKGESTSPVSITDEDFGTPAHPRFPYIPIGLYIGTIELARLNGISTLFFLTEERLAGHFSKLGVELKGIGRAVEHHGRRVPSMLDISHIEEKSVRTIFRPLYHVVAEDVMKGVAGLS
jgi:N-acyl amino acid synthase of PEP-CTERM/exosortase system